jgi:predicted glycoside hydrolase/deacetylase ChbG (UPF0249 family)
MKKIILCADDYALSTAVSTGIVELVERGRLSAVGCMTEAPFWIDKRNRLPELRDRVDIGLHFNLTQGFGSPKSSLQQILRSALLGNFSERSIEDALHDQLDRFESVMGEAPDFVDGHQHVHVFPRIRHVLLHTLARRYRLRRPWLRQVNPSINPGPDWSKRIVLALLDSRFAHKAQEHGFTFNKTFSGTYSLQSSARFDVLMRNWLSHANSGELLMCHPGHVDSNEKSSLYPADEIAATRPLEYAYLASDDFGAWLQHQGIELVRFRDSGIV